MICAQVWVVELPLPMCKEIDLKYRFGHYLGSGTVFWKFSTDRAEARLEFYWQKINKIDNGPMSDYSLNYSSTN